MTMLAYNLTQMVKEASRVTERSATLIDHIYVTSPVNVKDVFVPKISGSDHYPTCLTYGQVKNKSKYGKHTHVNMRQLKYFEVTSFNRDIGQVFKDWSPFEDIDLSVQNFSDTFTCS